RLRSACCSCHISSASSPRTGATPRSTTKSSPTRVPSRPLSIPDEAVSSYRVYTALVADERIDRNQLLENLNAEGIAAGLVRLPNDLYSALKDEETELPGVRRFADRQISLPCGWWLLERDCAHIAERANALARP